MDAVSASRRIAGAGTTAAAWLGDGALAALPATTINALVAPGARAVLVAPHPDDEILACGGLLQLLAGRAEAPLLIAVTDGEASHPDSPAWPRERLRHTRPVESEQALRVLGLGATRIVRLGIADGGVAAAEAQLRQRLSELLGPGDVVITTWRHDGHPDHEATARACVAAAAMCGARLLEVPVWGWHWCDPLDNAMPLARAVKLPLSPALLEAKRRALACFGSQTEVDASTGAAPILPPDALARLLTLYEVVFA